MIRGKFKRIIDEKGRVAIPSFKYEEESDNYFPENGTCTLSILEYEKEGRFNKKLIAIITPYNQQEDDKHLKLDIMDEKRIEYFSSVIERRIDAQKRIRLNDSFANLEAMVYGNGDCVIVEIMNKKYIDENSKKED